MGNNPAGHFFQQDLDSIKDAIEGFGSAFTDTVSGITSGFNFNYANTIHHWKNYGEDVRNAFTGSSDKSAGPPDSPEQTALKNYNRAIDPNASWNISNWKPMSAGSSPANPAYNPSITGNSSVKPSDLMKISDPTTKIAVAASRGVVRSTLNLSANAMDTQAAPQLMTGATPASTSTPVASTTPS